MQSNFTKRLAGLVAGLIIICFFPTQVHALLAAANIKVTTVPDEIYENESFNLIFSATVAVDGAPDFAPLEKDFTITNLTQRNDFKMFSGDFQRSDNWVVELIPDKAGDFTIPPISFGKDRSPELQVTIRPSDLNQNASASGFISELEVSSDHVFVGSQVIVTKRLLSTSRMARPSFSDLKASGVNVMLVRLDEGEAFDVIRGNTNYHVLEVHYALYPHQAGILALDSSVAVAQVAAGSDGNINPLMNNAITKRATSKPVEINVAPIPAPFTAQNWLPAADVQLSEEWPDNHAEYRVGEPLTRSLSIVVRGEGFARIPALPVLPVDHMKRYPDNPIRHDAISAEGITGSIKTRVVLIPTRPGTYTLPAIEMPWWNTETNTLSTATIPPRRITVAGTATNTTLPASPDSPPHQASEQTDDTTVATRTQSSRFLNWVSIILALGWVSTLILWFAYSRARKNSAQLDPQQHQTGIRQAEKNLKKACDDAQPQACEKALLAWYAALNNGQPLTSLGALGQHAGEPLQSEINKLEAALYSPNGSDWSAANIWRASRQINTKNPTKITPVDLEPMYR